MASSPPIQHLYSKDIDPGAWDRCISAAGNGLVYAYSFYLDHMAPGWEALVWGDYERVMPLTPRKKYGIAYLAQPFLTAQLGVFGPELDGDIIDKFLSAIPHRFRYVDIYLNHGNLFAGTRHQFYSRVNYILSLKENYAELRARYRENVIRNTKRALSAGCVEDPSPTVDEVIALASYHLPGNSPEIRRNVARFRALYGVLEEKKMARCMGIRLAGQLVSSAVFFFSHKRAYYILVGNHPNGRTIGASHALIDFFIREHAQQELLLDFEGSDLRNLAFFYSSFGAKEELYAGLRDNRLPPWLKWMKR